MGKTIIKAVAEGVLALYETRIDPSLIQLQRTRKDIEGDYTLVVFPLVRFSKKKPEDTAKEIGVFLKNKIEDITSYNVAKGFLNLRMSPEYWIEKLNSMSNDEDYGYSPANKDKYMLEYSSPNTNKPLHLGHIRNNLIGDALSRILRANGRQVLDVNLINDRGIHICKSMLAYQLWGENKTPESQGIKGDKFVGDFYVMFDKEYKKEVEQLVANGIDEKEAKQTASLIVQARNLLKEWESGDTQVLALWNKMNSWVYAGFDITYKRLGITFDELYYESETYLLGKKLVLEGIDKGIFYRKDDGSVWADLTSDGLDEKILLRADGTTVYITQDIGTAVQRFENNQLDMHIYVVGNEQKYHFQVLSLILKKMGYKWYNKIMHMSYGMVELPEGKMKSREGKVVDADDLLNEMLDTARKMADENGKMHELPKEEQENTLQMIALGALKYFILKVDPKRTMVFNPIDSIDFNGNTGPFIQYTNARILSILRNAKSLNIKFNGKTSDETLLVKKEVELTKLLCQFPEIIQEAGENLDPGKIANYCYEVAKEYNQYYHDHTILKERDSKILQFRLLFSLQVNRILERGMGLLGIDMPKRM